MKRISKVLAVVMVTLCTTGIALAQPAPAAAPAGADKLAPLDRSAMEWAAELAQKAGQQMEKWIDAGAVSQAKLFSYLYFPQPKTSPIKYTTDYDQLSDKDLGPLQEAYVTRAPEIAYVIIVDKNGYCPTHNRKFSAPLTGNPANDLENNRTKRIFNDRTGLSAARNTAPFLLQQYKRDTGETMYDMSVPLVVKGVKWGSVRIGYRAAAH